MKRSIFFLGLLGLAIAWDIHRGQWSDILVGGLVFAAYMAGAITEARKHESAR